MKLPKITQEILDKFGDGMTFIEEFPPYQWTQTAVDFAILIAQGDAEKIAELEAEIERMRPVVEAAIYFKRPPMK